MAELLINLLALFSLLSMFGGMCFMLVVWTIIFIRCHKKHYCENDDCRLCCYCDKYRNQVKLVLWYYKQEDKLAKENKNKTAD